MRPRHGRGPSREKKASLTDSDCLNVHGEQHASIVQIDLSLLACLCIEEMNVHMIILATYPTLIQGAD